MVLWGAGKVSGKVWGAAGTAMPQCRTDTSAFPGRVPVPAALRAGDAGLWLGKLLQQRLLHVVLPAGAVLVSAELS